MNSTNVSRFLSLAVGSFLLTCGSPVLAITIERLIGYGDPMPDRPDTVSSVGNPVFDVSTTDGKAVLAIQSGNFTSSFTGLYFVDRAKTFQRIVSTETPRPGGGNMAISTSMLLAVHGTVVYFIEVDPQSFTTRLYKVPQPGTAPLLIATQGDAAPGGKLLLFNGITAHAGGLLFEATYQEDAGDSWLDVFNYDGSTISSGLLGKLKNEAPGTTGFLFWNQYNLGAQANGTEFTCLANAYNSLSFPPNIQGIFGLPLPGSASTGRKVVDTLTTVPGFTPGPGTTFALADLSQQLPNTAFDTDGSRTVFLGKTQGNSAHGVYSWDGNQLNRVADGTTLRPGTSDTFKFTGSRFNDAAVAVSGTKIVFRALDVNGVAGIYLKDNSNFEEIVAEGQQVAGVDLFGVGLTRDGFHGDQILFSATAALWRATLGTAPPMGVSLTFARVGDSAQVSWDGQAAGAGAVLEETANLTANDWKPVQNQANPYPFAIDTGARFFRLRQ